VSCRLGRLYNKDALIEFLLDRSLYGDGENICGHIKSLKASRTLPVWEYAYSWAAKQDVKVLTLTPNPQWSKKINDTDPSVAQFVCPLTVKEMNGAVPFVYLRSCGCVFSQAGLRALSSTPPSEPEVTPKQPKEPKDGEVEKKLCLQCNSKYDPTQDVFTINPRPAEEALMLERLLSLPKLKSKKRKAVESAEDAPETKRLSVKTEVPTQTMNAQVSRSSKKVVEGMADQEKKRLATMSDAVRSIYQGKNGNVNRSNWISQGTFTRVRTSSFVLTHC
jgi:hypothetical protein